VNAGGASQDATTCTVNVDNKSATGPCSSVTVGGLYASNSYNYSVTAKNPAGTSGQGAGTASTQIVNGAAHCEPFSSDADVQQWCKERNPGNALEVVTNTSTLHGSQIDKTTSGNTYAAYCWTTGVDVDSYKYNSNKHSNIWVSIRWGGDSAPKKYYTPLSWLNINGGTGSRDVGPLPPC